MADPMHEDSLTHGEDAEDWDEDEDYDDEDDEDIDAEAQEIARRLGEQLWADISKANAVVAGEESMLGTDTMEADAAESLLSHPSGEVTTHVNSPQHSSSKKEEAIIATMKYILELVANDSAARLTLATTSVPVQEGGSVLDMLQNCVHSNTVSKTASKPLSQILVSLARSEALFGTLRHSNASSIQLNKGKRKRDETIEEFHQHDTRIAKRPYIPDTDLHNQIAEAVRVITSALAVHPAQPLDPAVISSIRLQLHQVFLFAVTSSAGGGPEVHALQEIGGLIQVIGVLSGIQIGQQPPESIPGQPAPLQHNPAYPWLPNQTPPITDIGTAVYPCLIAGCRKTFSRLYSLRAHQRSHATHRPYRCNLCPASFARNHDLKRHIKLHDRIAWKCVGCQKVFSRRDAIKRHKNGSRTRGPKSEACVDAEVVEVELDEADDDSLREERRAKLWNGIAINQANAAASHAPVYRNHSGFEEGEIQPAIISGIQATIISLHGLLQAHVGNTLGAPVGQPSPMPMDSTNGQATLASVIARAQLQSLPPVATASTESDYPASTDHDMYQSTSANEVEHANGDDVLQNPEDQTNASGFPSLSMYGLSDEQTKLLEIAIANAASAAQAQAEAEAALEEEEEDYGDEDEEDESDGQRDMDQPDMTE